MFLLTCDGCGERIAEYASSGWEEIGDDTWLCPTCLARGERSGVRGFNEPEDGSRERYRERRASIPWAQHTAWWVVHNVIAHPLIGVLPVGPAFAFHDWTSRKMHGR